MRSFEHLEGPQRVKDLVDFELISACLFPEAHRQYEEALRLSSQHVPHSTSSTGSGQLLSCEKVDAWHPPFKGDSSWLIFLKTHAYQNWM